MKRIIAWILAVLIIFSATAFAATMGESNALLSAQSYLEYSAFSYVGLIEQLEYEGYSSSEATYAVNNCGADWNEQALKSARSYLAYAAFSYEGLIEQLEYEEFTNEQAVYAANNCGANWYEQAVKCAKSYLEYTSFSLNDLIEQLEYEGFTHDQAIYGVDQNGYASTNNSTQSNEKTFSEEEKQEIAGDIASVYLDSTTTNHNEWEYFSENSTIPIPASCIKGIKQPSYDGSMYIFPIDSEIISLKSVLLTYTTILMKDCGMECEHIEGPMYSINDGNKKLAIFGTGSDPDIGEFFVVSFLSSSQSTEDESSITSSNVFNAEYEHMEHSEGEDKEIDNEIIEPSGDAYANSTSFDFSDLSFAELVSLKDQINLAIWNSEEWQEVIVPQGVWIVGEDIPAGTWTIKCAEGGFRCEISWGENLGENGESIKASGRYSIFNYITNPEHKSYEPGNDMTEYTCTVQDGDYIVVHMDESQALFTPYAGKPSLGFK